MLFSNLQLMKNYLFVLPLAYLWFLVFDSVRLEWTTNPQYSYGWFVPILMIGLLLKNWQSGKNSLSSNEQTNVSRLAIGLCLLGGLVMLPARFIAASTPEWRPLQWTFGFMSVGATLLYLQYRFGKRGLELLGFPIAFFLVAIPWPSPIEQPIIQSLTRADSALVVELMGLLGVPTVQHGNLLEVSSGIVGVDEACSGIRSFQSSLMISLFLGEFYRLCWKRRLGLVGIGIILSFLFNVCRTALLTWVAAKKGVSAIATYHDPAGLAILIICTLSLLLVGAWMGRKGQSNEQGQESKKTQSDDSNVVANQRKFFEYFGALGLFRISLVLCIWLSLIEIACFAWFSYRESKTSGLVKWTMVFPTNSPSFKQFKIAENTYKLLCYDDGTEVEWKENDGSVWHLYYFDWYSGRVAGYLAKRHTPEACLTGVGYSMLSGPDLFLAKIHGVTLPIRQYVFKTKNTKIHVFHCRWEAGTEENASVKFESSRMNLLRGIWAGRGKNGQQVFEVIIEGYDTAAEAKAALLHRLDGLIKSELPLTPEKHLR